MRYISPAMTEIVEKAVRNRIEFDYNPKTGMISLSPDELRTMVYGLLIVALNEKKYAKWRREQPSLPVPVSIPAKVKRVNPS